mmetsp:Transcript_41413/g.88965  ORF Transcript_41413/g.88965 Transcript_41413/m.88965 type:complete len:224 (-) Transcript_41413:1141-1812(-)
MHTSSQQRESFDTWHDVSDATTDAAELSPSFERGAFLGLARAEMENHIGMPINIFVLVEPDGLHHGVLPTGLAHQPRLTRIRPENRVGIKLLEGIDTNRDGVVHSIFSQWPQFSGATIDLCENLQSAPRLFPTRFLHQSRTVVNQYGWAFTVKRCISQVIARELLTVAACARHFLAERHLVVWRQQGKLTHHLQRLSLGHQLEPHPCDRAAGGGAWSQLRIVA